MKVPSVTDMARSYLEEAIYSGRFKPGCQVKEERVATALGISRPPIREAFKMLEAEGILHRVPRRGVFVTEIKDQDAMEIYTLKAELYAFSIRISFHRLSESDLSRMGRIVDAMEACIQAEPPNVVSYQELNVGFHSLHVDTARHGRLKQILNTLHNQVRYYSFQTLQNRQHLERSCRYHRQIFEACRMGDMEAAVALSREHVLIGLERLHTDSREMEQPTQPDAALPFSGADGLRLNRKNSKRRKNA